MNPLINLPYIIDGEVCCESFAQNSLDLHHFYCDFPPFKLQLVVTQSNACLKYLGRKFDLLGSNDAELTLIEQCIFQVCDLQTLFWIDKDLISHINRSGTCGQTSSKSATVQRSLHLSPPTRCRMPVSQPRTLPRGKPLPASPTLTMYADTGGLRARLQEPLRPFRP